MGNWQTAPLLGWSSLTEKLESKGPPEKEELPCEVLPMCFGVPAGKRNFSFPSPRAFGLAEITLGMSRKRKSRLLRLLLRALRLLP